MILLSDSQVNRERSPGSWDRGIPVLLACLVVALAACTAGPDAVEPTTQTPPLTLAPVTPTNTPQPEHSLTPTVAEATVGPPAAGATPLNVTVTATPAPTQTGGAPLYTYQVVNTYPHDPEAFTQGLVFDGDTLYEGTGRYGFSSLREVDLETGRVTRSVALSDDLFGEGIAVIDERIVQLTWRSNLGPDLRSPLFRAAGGVQLSD